MINLTHLLVLIALLGSGLPLHAQQIPEEERLTAASASQATSVIRFRITGLRNDQGVVACGLFVSENWLRAGAVGETAKITDGEAVCLFRGVAPGTYGISAYHDENANKKLDSNFLRIPKEGTAASNDARGRLGPPKFNDARFDYAGDVLELEGSMHYR